MTRHDEHMLPHATCPVDQLEWFVNHTLSAEEQASIEAHLTTCSACQAKVTAWAELRQAMRAVSIHTPEPRTDLFMQIERQLDLLPASTPWFRMHRLLQACWHVLIASGELFVAQARLIRRDLFWMPLLFIPLICLVVYLPPPWPYTTSAAALFTGLLTAFGIAFLYGQDVDPAREITLVTLTSPRLVLGIRCCLVFGYDLLLNCGLVLPILTLHSTITPAWFLANWLAPLCCLSAIALLLSILTNAATAVLVCALLWALRLLSSVHTFLAGSVQSLLPQAPWQQQYESFWHQGLLLFVITVLFVLLAFIVLERKERFAR